MAFNVSTISAYTNQTAEELVKKAVATGVTLDKVTLLPGVKYKTALNILDNTVTVNDATCGFSSTGSVAFSQRDITVTDLEVKESLCEKTLEQYWMGQMFKPGSPKEEQLGAVLADSYVQKIQEFNEYTMWQGNISGSSYTKFDGFLTHVSESAAYVSASAAGTALSTGSFTTSNIIAAVDAMVSATPEDIMDKPDLYLFMSYANYMTYGQALRTANLYQTPAVGDVSTFEMYIPGTTIKAVATKGLSGTNAMLLTYGTNLVVGTDLLNEEEKFDIWYSRDNDEVRVNIQWKLGTQVYFPAHVVCNYIGKPI